MENVTLLVQASLVFVNPETNQKIQLQASPKPQTAPAWVIETPTYTFAFKQGLVYAINYVAPPPQVEKAMPADVAKAFGFNPPNTPTFESLTKAGLTPEAAQIALAAMSNNATANAAPPPVKEVKAKKSDKVGNLTMAISIPQTA